MTRIFNGIVAAACLAAAAALAWMTALLAGPPDNSIVDTLVMLTAAGGALACTATAVQEFRKPAASETGSAAMQDSLNRLATLIADSGTTTLTDEQRQSVTVAIHA